MMNVSKLIKKILIIPVICNVYSMEEKVKESTSKKRKNYIGKIYTNKNSKKLKTKNNSDNHEKQNTLCTDAIKKVFSFLEKKKIIEIKNINKDWYIASLEYKDITINLINEKLDKGKKESNNKAKPNLKNKHNNEYGIKELDKIVISNFCNQFESTIKIKIGKNIKSLEKHIENILNKFPNASIGIDLKNTNNKDQSFYDSLFKKIKNKPIVSINFSGNGINDKNINEICESLKKHKIYLKEVDFSINEITNIGAEKLLKQLLEKRGITKIDISENCIGNNEIKEEYDPFENDYKKLTSLEILQNKNSKEAFKGIVKLIKEHAYVKINMDNNNY